MTDPDELDDVAPPLRVGSVDVGDDEHVPHPAGWLYVPDLSELSGWASHRVPVGPQRDPRRIGFRP